MSQFLGRSIAVACAGIVAAIAMNVRAPMASAAPSIVHGASPVTITPTNKYAEVCAVCHQGTGLGLEGAFPPLAGSEWLNGRAVVPIAIVLHGLQGEISVKGKTYNGAMVAWGSVLNDEDLAATLTYARSQWGNRATAVTAAQVRAVRARFASRTTPWTSAELKAIR